MSRQRRLISRVAVAVAATAATAGAVLADTSDDQSQIQEIVVTAQRRSENLQQVPISINALSSDDLKKLDINNVQQLEFASPGLFIQTDSEANQISIRGVGTGYSGSGLEGSVAVYSDETYIASQVGVTQGLLDISNIQVLDGPQGTLWGRNATGGAILINTNDPSLNALDGHVAASYGNLNWYDVEGVVNIPVSSTVAIRVAADSQARDGYLRNTYFDRNVLTDRRDLIRLKLLWEPVENFTSIAKLEYSHQGQDIQARAQGLPPPLCSLCLIPGAGITPASSFYDTDQSQPVLPSFVNIFLGSLKLNYQLDDLAFTNVTSYRTVTEEGDSDQDISPLTVEDVTIPGRRYDKSFTEDLRVVSNYGGPLNFLAGLFYEHDHNRFPLGLNGSALGPLNVIFSNLDDLTSYSALGELYYKITPALKLTVGARFNKDQETHSFSNNPDAQIVFGQAGGIEEAGSTDTTPRVVLAYEAGPGNYYVSYNQGFKAGGFNSPAGTTESPVKPEKITAYEVGAKFVLADNRVRFNAAFFHYDWKDIQVSFVDSSTGGLFTANAAAAKNNGVDFNAELVPLSGLTFDVGGVFMHSRFTSFAGAAVYCPAGPPNYGLASCAENATGTPTTRAPNFTGNVAAKYQFNLASGYSMNVTNFWRYTSAYYFDPLAGGPAAFDQQRAFTIGNLSATLLAPQDRYEIKAYVDNLNGVKYTLNRTTSNFGGYYLAGLPRTYGLRVQYNF